MKKSVKKEVKKLDEKNLRVCLNSEAWELLDRTSKKTGKSKKDLVSEVVVEAFKKKR